MSNETKIVIAVGAGIAILFGVFIAVAQNQKKQTSVSTPPADLKEVLVRPDSHGTANTPTRVTITEFGDYQCPACGTAHPIVKDILKEYAGKVTLVFRHFPLASHAHARSAAYAAEAAALQGKFWGMHDMIYDRQGEWSEHKDPKSVFRAFAGEIGLNVEQFSKDMGGSDVLERVNRDLSDGERAGVDATPTFFVNAQRFVGVPSKELKDLLESELKKK